MVQQPENDRVLGWQLYCHPWDDSTTIAPTGLIRFSRFTGGAYAQAKYLDKIVTLGLIRCAFTREQSPFCKIMDVGVEWIVDATGCRSDKLADMDILRDLSLEILAGLDLHVVGEGQWHKFPSPGGVTALFLLTESHLSLHTYPECGVATFNLYCCRERRRWPWEERLKEVLRAKETFVRKVVRGSIVRAEEEAADIVSPDSQEVG